MADVPVPSIATATPAAADSIVGVQGGNVRRFLVSALGAAVAFLQAGTGAVSRSMQDKLRETLSVKDFGVVGDGVTDDTLNLRAALTYAAQNGLKIFWPSGSYAISGNLLPMSSFSSPSLNIEFGAVVSITVTGSGNFQDANKKSVMQYVTSAAHSVVMTGGSVEVDCGNIASVFFSTGFTGAQCKALRIDCAKLLIKNCFAAAGATQGSHAIYTNSDYETAVIRNVHINGVSRDASLNASYATQALLIANNDGRCLIENCVIENIGSASLTQDCDCIVLRGSNAGTVGAKVLGNYTIRNCVFRNTRGRHVKAQSSDIKVLDCEFWQTNIQTISSGQSIDFQFGNGVVRGNRFIYRNNAGVTTLGASFTVVQMSATMAVEKQHFYIHDNRIESECDITAPFSLASSNASAEDAYVEIRDNSIVPFANSDASVCSVAVLQFRCDQLEALAADKLWDLHLEGNKVKSAGYLISYSGYTGASIPSKLRFTAIDNKNEGAGLHVFNQTSGNRISNVTHFRVHGNSGWYAFFPVWTVNLTNNALPGRNEFSVDLANCTFTNKPAALPASGYAVIEYGENSVTNWQPRRITVGDGSATNSTFYTLTGTWTVIK